MTIDALRGKGRTKTTRAPKAKEPEPLAIGEADSNIFNCPACARPLAVGTSRCPGCATRLIIGVQAKRASVFLGLGLVAGLMVGGGVMAVVDTIPRVVASATPVDPVVGASSAPGATSVPVATLAPPGDPSIPTSAVSALRLSALLNQRVVANADRLAAALAARPISSGDIAKVLRVMSADAAFGDRIAPDVAEWAAGSGVSEGLASFYGQIARTAKDGLSASLANTRAFVAAGQRMLVVVGGLTELDAAARSLAATAELELPPVDLSGLD